MKIKLNDLEKILNYKFKNINFLKKSLVHKSYDSIDNNEKLEFLGDRVLGLIISKKLIELYPSEKEGIIDKKFANLVNKKKCAEIAEKISLHKFILLGPSHKSFQKSADKILSDCIEAIIGAVYIDSGINEAEKLILQLWKKSLEKSDFILIDSKTRLQEYCLKKYKILPKYTFYKKTGPQHKPVFKTDVQIPGTKKIIGIGNSKKNAQQNAANKLLEFIKNT